MTKGVNIVDFSGGGYNITVIHFIMYMLNMKGGRTAPKKLDK